MIVDSMTYEEICREYDKIEKVYTSRVNTKIFNGKIRRYMIKHKNATDIVFPAVTCRVDNNTNFHGIPIVYNYQFFINSGIARVYILTHRSTKHGFFAMRVMEEPNHKKLYFVITEHFIDRYEERFLKSGMNREEITCRFFAKNMTFTFVDAPTQNNPSSLMVLGDEIVLLAERPYPSVIINNTCLTKKMLFKEQKEMRKLLDVDYQRIVEYRERLRETLMKKQTGPFRITRC